MVLNDIIEQAAGRHSRASDHGGEIRIDFLSVSLRLNELNFINFNKVIFLLIPDDD